MKWLRVLLNLLAILLLGVIAFALVGIYLYHGTPRWYHRKIATTQQVKDAANRADQKLIDLFSWAASAQAQDQRRLAGRLSPAEAPVGPKTITFDDEEINSFAASWKGAEKTAIQERISRYFTDGRVVFGDDAIILVGQSPSFGTLASAEFTPSIDGQGKLHVDFSTLRAGLLPVPQSTFSSQLQRLQELLREQLLMQQGSVQIDSGLRANASALAASWLRLLLSAMDDQAADADLIIPFNMSNLGEGFPVRVTAIHATEGQITLTLEPVPAQDRRALVQRLKEAWGAGEGQ
jgi:hypothetical protein